MKFATRISSIRRHAWKQCRSCSADSDSMCDDSFASSRAGRVDALALALQHPRDRVLGQPVDLKVRHQRSQLTRDRHVPLRVAQADRRGDVQRPLAACPRTGPGRSRGALGLDEVAQHQVDLDRVARLRAVARALEG